MQGMVLKDLSKSFRLNDTNVKALDGVHLEMEKGSFLSIVGYSGCGKTTLLNTIMGLQNYGRGEIRFMGMEGRTAMVFQEPRLISALSVEKNMSLALKHEKDPSERERILDRTLEMLGLTAFRTALPCQLSGGMAQRVSLGRALCRQPEFLLMDEPFGSLDALNRKKLQGELINIYRKEGITILFVTHDVTEAVLLGNRVCVMERGAITREIQVPLDYPRNSSSPECMRIRDQVLGTILRENSAVLQH